MAGYTHEYSNFPNEIMDKKTYRNVTDKDATLINMIKNFESTGDYVSAANIIATNPSIKECMIDNTDFNALLEQIRNTQIFAKSVKQGIYYQEAPLSPIDGDVFIE